MPTPVAKAFPINTKGMGILVDLETMKAALKDPRTVKLDVRDVDEWIAESSSPYGKDFCPRKGRIPGAAWIEWYRMMKPTPTGPMFKSRRIRNRRYHPRDAGTVIAATPIPAMSTVTFNLFVMAIPPCANSRPENSLAKRRTSN